MSARQIIKLAVAAILLAVIAARVDVSAALGLIAGAKPGPILFALATCFAIIAADAGFWAISMRNVGFRIGFWPAATFSLVGWFFANLAPSTLGSDIFRAAQMRAAGADSIVSARLVIAARAMSFAALIPVIGAGFPFAMGLIAEPAERVAVAAAFALGALLFAGFVIAGSRLAHLKAARAAAIAAFASDMRTLLLKTSVSGWLFLTAQHLLRIAGVAAVAAAMNITIDPVALFALVPAALLIAMAPVSVGGWGVREAGMVHFLGYAGVEPAAALAISITYGLTRTFIGAIGGVLWTILGADRYRFAIGDKTAH